MDNQTQQTKLSFKSTHFKNSLQLKLFSSARLNGYASPQEHEDNLRLIASIAHKIGVIEIILRNKIDSCLLESNINWLENLPKKIKLEGDLKKQNRDKIVSIQSIGFWRKIVEYHRIHNQIFDIAFLDNLDFKKYFEKNKNRFSREANLRAYHKAEVILLLLHLIRNRAFHFENLYKITEKGYPRLNVKINNKRKESIYIAIHPSKIKDFLDDLLASFDENLVCYGENKIWCFIQKIKRWRKRIRLERTNII